MGEMDRQDVGAFVDGLTARGVRLFMLDGRLQCEGPREVITDEVLEAVRRRREEIVALATARSDPTRPQPLTAGQRSLLLHQRLAPDSAAYNLAYAARVNEPLDTGRLDAALRKVVVRHPILRTTWDWNDGAPAQHVVEVPERLLVEELAPDGAIDQVVELFLDQPFDLGSDLPIRALVARSGAGDDRPVLALVVHHIAADLTSVALIVDQWLAEYRMDSPRLEGTGAWFGDRGREEAGWLAGTEAETNLEFWRSRLAGLPEVTNLPTDHSRPAVQTFRGSSCSAEVSPELSRRLLQIAADRDVSPNMLFLTALQVFLRKYGDSDDVVVGTPSAGRRATDDQGVVGFFADPVVVRADLSGNPEFAALLAATRAELLRALDHPYPFPSLVERLNPARDPSRSPFFQVMYVWQQSSVVPRLTPLDSSRQRGAPYDLVLTVRPEGQRFVCSWTYNVDLFELVTIDRFARGFLALLNGIASRPEARVAALPTGADEDVTAFSVATGPVVTLPERDWPEQFADQVRRTPDAVALQCGEEALTYRELHHRVGELAAALLARGAGPDVRIGVCLDRSVELVTVLLAVARAGAAYVPLDPSYPEERLRYIADDAKVSLCVVDAAGGRAAAGCEGQIVTLADLTADSQVETVSAPAESLAYVIHTSGSTGRPKGVMLTRRNVANLFEGLDRAIGEARDEQPVLLAVTSVCFDISVLELFWTLCRGYRVVVERSQWTVRPDTARALARPLDFSLFYFAAEPTDSGKPLYRLLLDGARFADAHGLHAVWVPERHFHTFGAAYPNPSVLAAAIAAVTSEVRIRAGSVVLPLQDTLRVTEEWAAVDNLSGGRVGLSFASGWHPDDFVLAPDRFATRREALWDDIDEARRLWRGEPVRRRNGVSAEIDVRTLPRPLQEELPVWVTAAGTEETFRRAGTEGANLLTHLLGQNIEELARKIKVYRGARAAAGHDEGVVTLMLHTFVHPDSDVVAAAVAEPFKNYLRTSVDLMRGLAAGMGLDPDRHRDVLVEHAFTRFSTTSALFGTPDECVVIVEGLSAIGVDEIACLIDFGVDDDLVLGSLNHLATLRTMVGKGMAARTPAGSITAHNVTDLQCTPALARMMLLDEQRESLPNRVLVGGESVSQELAAGLRAAGVSEAFTMYGPTETCVWSAVQRMRVDADVVEVGGPLANTSLYVLDQHLRPVAAGVAGELYIGGAGVGRGYWDRPGMTAGRFVADPCAAEPGARMYATGDVVRPLGDGRFEFLGRADHQVKVRGFRIETGEIESVLVDHHTVKTAVVVATTDSTGDSVMVAFVVPRTTGELDDGQLRAHLRRALPDYMIPSRIVRADRLPLTLNGKVDRRALKEQALVGEQTNVAYVAPRNKIEDSLQRIWKDLLGRDRVGVHENFFEIGGHSLLAAKMHADIVTAGIGHVELVDLFTHPTIALLAGHLGDDHGHDEHGALVSRVGRQRAAALAQQRRRRDR